MRPAAPVLLLSVAATLLAGCGKTSLHDSTNTSRSGSTTAPGSAPATPAGAKARATVYAHLVNLRVGDVPGFTPSAKKQPKHETATEKSLEEKLRRCTGASTLNEVADVGSKEFKRSAGPFSQSVSSNVTVAQTPAEAARELKAIHARGVRKCLSQYVEAVLKNQDLGHVTVAPVSIAEGSPPAPGTTGSFGWRITSGLEVHAIKIPFYMDILGFVDGPAEVTLVSFGIPRPLPAETEEQLFTLLVQRAAAHAI
jgi:hypothetical protein